MGGPSVARRTGRAPNGMIAMLAKKSPGPLPADDMTSSATHAPWSRRITISLAIIAVLGVWLPFHWEDSTRSDILPSYDAYYWLELSETIRSTETVPTTLPRATTTQPVNYQTTFPVLMTAFSDVTGIALLDSYRIVNTFVLVCLTFAVFCTLRRLGANEAVSGLGTLMLFSAPYMLYRHIFPLPENVSLVFIGLLLWAIAGSTGSKRMVLPFVIVILASAILNHHRSTLLILGLLGVWAAVRAWTFVASGNRTSLMRTFAWRTTWPVAAPLGLLLLASAAKAPEIWRTLLVYAGRPEFEGYTWRELEPVPGRFAIPGVDDYRTQIGDALLVLSVLGFVLVALTPRRWPRWTVPVALWVAALLLTQSLRIGFYAPPGRFYTYFALGCVPLAAYCLTRIVRILEPTKWIRAGIAITLAIVLLIPTVQALEDRVIFYGFTKGDFEAAEFLNARTEPAPIISYGGFAFHLGLDPVETDYVRLHRIFGAASAEQLNETLGGYYGPNVTAFLLVTDKVYPSMLEKYPGSADLLAQGNVVFAKGRTVAVRIG